MVTILLFQHQYIENNEFFIQINLIKILNLSNV